MRWKWLGLVFPLLVLGLMAAERLATFLLGLAPSSAALWQASLELRAIFRGSAAWLEFGSGGVMALQLCALVALAALLTLAMGTRRWATLSFLVNHMALLFVATAAVLASGSRIASSDGSFLASSGWLLSGSIGLDALQYAVLALGLAGCAACHWLFLAEKAAGHRAVIEALGELAFSLEGRRSAR